MSETARTQAEGLQFLREYRSAFTTRGDGSKWPRWEQTWLNATRYFRGLLRPGSNTATDIAKKMHADQERLERFVRESPWEHENVEAELRERAPEAAQGEDAALVVDGMGIPKVGDNSAGVSRQWCGATGKVDNCQVTVNCTLARPGERHNADQVTWPLGMRLYLSKKWADAEDADYDSQQERERYGQRRNDADHPDDIEYRSKRDLALESLAQIAATDIDYWTCQLIRTHPGEFLLNPLLSLVMSVDSCLLIPATHLSRSLCPTQNECISKPSSAERRLLNVMRSVLGSFC